MEWRWDEGWIDNLHSNALSSQVVKDFRLNGEDWHEKNRASIARFFFQPAITDSVTSCGTEIPGPEDTN